MCPVIPTYFISTLKYQSCVLLPAAHFCPTLLYINCSLDVSCCSRTYNSIECYPSAKLNMIVGPNGTGKSSLVNAIVLGLGGKTNIIGRAKQLSAYVKRGCKTAKIEIELYSEPSNYTIGREFNIDNKSSWTINGQTVPYKEVEKVIKEMNIQVDNLCQFLPQDRVQDFAKMDSKQLLENTLKTVGSRDVVSLHEKLRELREKETGLDSRTKVLRQNLDSEKKKISRLENEVQAIKERQEMNKKVKTMEMKKAWLEVSEKEEKKKKVQADRKKIQDIKKKAEERLVPFEREIEKTKAVIKTINKEIDKEIKLCGDSISAGRHNLGVVETAEDQISSIKNDLKQKLDSANRTADKIRSLEEEIQNLETMIQPEKESRLQQKVAGIQPQVAGKSEELRKMQRQMQDVEESINEVVRNKNRIEGALEREMSAANKKLKILEEKFPDTYHAFQWLEKNRDQFNKRIYGPIMLEINCNEDVAKFVEFTIPHRDLVMFVCEDKNDMNQLLQTVRDGMKLRINAATATRNFDLPPRDNYRPVLDLQRIKRYGFSDYMINQVDGPNAVLNYLCHNFGLHVIPLGNRQTSSMIEEIPKEIRSFFSDTQHFSVKYSKYSGERSSRIVDVRQSYLLAGSTNTAAVAEYQRSIKGEEEKLKALRKKNEDFKSSLSMLERETNDLRQQKRDLDHELSKLKVGRSRLNMRKEELRVTINHGTVDPENEKAKAETRIKKVIIALASEPRNIVKHLKNTQNSLLQNIQHKQKQSLYQRILRDKQKEGMEASKALEDANRMVVNVEQELREITRTWERVKAKALEMTGGCGPGDSRFRLKYEKEFSELPDDMEALDREISETTARVDCMAGGRESAVNEYEKTKKLIAELERDVANPEQKLEALRQDMSNTRNKWLPQVLDLINRVNNNFTTFFSLMNCIGEVSLEIPDDQDEYSQYGICIRVQFRDSGTLQKLGPHTQSGGERAVATAIYMLSLQELTTVPFRCVDEINQGMDENNERVVFRLMVNTVEKANSAQCFLLTPKVLHNLEYSENVRVLCIYSGVGAISHHQFNVNKFFKKVGRYSEQLQRESLKRKHVESDDSD